MPGRLMSLSVIGTLESSVRVRSSRERFSPCCSWSWGTVSCAGLVEFNQSHLPVVHAVGDPQAFPLRFRKQEHGASPLENRTRRRLFAQEPAPRPHPNDRHRALLGSRGELRRDSLLAQAGRALLPILHALLLSLE